MNDYRDILNDFRVPAYHCGNTKYYLLKGGLPMRTEYDFPSFAKPLNFTSFYALFTLQSVFAFVPRMFRELSALC